VVRHITHKPKADRAVASDPEERILLENYFLPGDLEAQIKAFVDPTTISVIRA
jgi:hypothetical protein